MLWQNKDVSRVNKKKYNKKNKKFFIAVTFTDSQTRGNMIKLLLLEQGANKHILIFYTPLGLNCNSNEHSTHFINLINNMAIRNGWELRQMR